MLTISNGSDTPNIPGTVAQETYRDLHSQASLRQVNYIFRIQKQIKELWGTVPEKVDTIFILNLCKFIDRLFDQKNNGSFYSSSESSSTASESSSTASESGSAVSKFISLKKTKEMPLKMHLFWDELNTTFIRVYIKTKEESKRKGAFQQMAPALGIIFSTSVPPEVCKVARLRPIKGGSEDVRLRFEHAMRKSEQVQTKASMYALKTLDIREYKGKGTVKIIAYTEFLEYDLYDYLEELERSSSLTRIDHIFSSLIIGISQIHSMRLVHGNIKSDNILVSKNGRVIKYCNFEHVQSFESFKNFGTLDFLSPEVFRELRRIKSRNSLLSFKQKKASIKIDPGKVDIWALGCVFYFVLKKRLPPWTFPLGICLELNNIIGRIRNKQKISTEIKEKKNSEQPSSSVKKKKWCLCGASQVGSASSDVKSMDIQGMSAVDLQESKDSFLGDWKLEDMDMDPSTDLKRILDIFKGYDQKPKDNNPPLFLSYDSGIEAFLRNLNKYLLIHHTKFHAAHLEDLRSLEKIFYEQLEWVWKAFPRWKIEFIEQSAIQEIPFIKQYHDLTAVMLNPDPDERPSIEYIKKNLDDYREEKASLS